MPRRNQAPISSKWANLLRRVPGYDPVATAEDCTFHPAEAEHVLRWFPGILRHVKGEQGGKPFVLERWQQAILANLFGWKRPDRTRRYREVLLFIPRKNGKTAWAAGVALYVLTNDDEPGMEIYSAAADRDQASLVYAHAEGMVLQSPELTYRLKIYKTAKAIVNEARMSSYKVISAEANTKHGFSTHLAIIDETHAQPNRELIDVITTSTSARRQPLIVHTTTSDYDRPSICNEKYEYACKVRDGLIRDVAFLPVIYEADDKKWQSKREWRRVNPNLGVSKSMQYMEREYKRAKETPAYENTFKRLELNIKTRLVSKWLDMERWDASAGVVDAVALQKQPCYAGLDLGATADLTSLCLLFPQEVGYQVLWWHWCPQETAHRRRNRDRIDYLQWAALGVLELTPGNETDYRLIRQRILAIASTWPFREIAIDRLFQGAQLCQDLVDDFGEERVVPFGMGYYSMAAPTQELERLINRGELHHGGNPLVRWMASNCIVKTDEAGNLKPDKSKSADKIDGIVSLLMALGRAMVATAETGPSVYEIRGIRTL